MGYYLDVKSDKHERYIEHEKYLWFSLRQNKAKHEIVYAL